ncbi:bifunctional 5,10-methylene-tetrahydrofolate dehydrogenase/5,10-methylene-tetrahydrofolate cyclohydrolase [Chlamydia muridarum str. Nigg]|jgi:5,10-methylene-tetrahydrofolate dehydrogenase/Methenyl tetrahydrofolate cyclohydrolase|uniref:Bifunctional protein FolD n=2 Tax=Chlamydia muridarum TaxID=83560 RepID=FOLD_CHLMU|nr:bifunctional methylenetetrahydrofolate dehydrogenase/methenyltetrahydrofolate cyclohydrolase FolD [Chlamydia muridarum]Q9PKW1.1 RecName: Full=Bifunctional protein FolD; Includes: RecName: Full=Methylenetetrahydrofolate dehydrogenase; Includes: RecName: Full=Methenyltetrahydrofolate cyclohydrolase [Chlamydia muridarum str. Nigg]AAF39211.1 methylenetetrahydrofolate dehydrogenase/methenyltetrahydrofolate cyclohydrolase [Chlamydia muridarum str. Nigg]AHH22741.1 methenyltetrahydrofolate cyclohydro
MLLKGAPAADGILATVKDNIRSQSGSPGLAVVLIGNNPASEIYVNMKVKRARDLGMISRSYRKPSDATLSDILSLIHELNCDENIHGVLVQLPLPKHLDTQTILSSISPNKDVDGLHPVNMGKLLLGETDGFIPCTPSGIVELFKYYEIPLYGKHVVILGRSNIVGKPLSALLMQKHADTNASVTVLHSQSEHLKEITKTADILVSAIGVPLFVTKEMISEKCIVIDVGTSRVPADNPKGYSLVGDVDFNNVVPVCQAITPVPGGVGPMTVAMLMRNTWESFLRHTL